MEKISESNIVIYDEDIIQTYEYIDVIKMEEGYRIHNICSGLILRVDSFSAYLISILKEQTCFSALLSTIKNDLSNMEIDVDLIKGVIEYFLDLGIVRLCRRKYNTKVLLINPCYRYSNNVYREISIVPPLGILYIATELFNAGYDVTILDMLLMDMRPDELETYVKKNKPDLVGISMNFTSTADVCYEIAHNLKAIGIKHIFVGGNHATFTYQDAIEKEDIDYVVRYQGEKTVLELADIVRRESWDELRECKGLVYKKEKEIFLNEVRENADINERSVPAWHLLDIFKYKEDNRWSINTSQGCPCACVFCSTSAFNDKMYFMNVNNIMMLLKKICRIEGGKRISISFSDDAFTCNRQRIIKLCNRIISENVKIVWACSTRVDLVDRELLDIMYKAGCRAVLFGIESCCNETLKKVGKKIDIERAEKAINLAKEVGMKVKEMFILGLPYETKESTEKIEEFVRKTKPDEVRFGMLSIYPGTPIWNNSEKYGINLLTRNWGDYDLLRPTSENSQMSGTEIYEQYIKLTEIYENID